MNLNSLPPAEKPADRLDYYQVNREIDEERKRVEAALKVPEKERTQAERNAIAYSVFGSASTCGY